MRNQRIVRKMNRRAGLSLLEVLVAVAFVGISISALVIISNAAISAADDSRNQAVADQYVRQALEVSRVYRDKNGWQSFLDAGGSTLAVNATALFKVNGTSLEYKATNPSGSTCTITKTAAYLVPGTTDYYQSVTLKRTATDAVEVTGTVCYRYRGGTNRSVSVQTTLTNWQ